jgi:hypothetical protein
MNAINGCHLWTPLMDVSTCLCEPLMDAISGCHQAHKTKCTSRVQMLGFAPYLRTWEGCMLQNQQSVHLACEVRK